MYTRAPTPTFALIRMHAPCADRFSIRACSDRSVPELSSHDASTKIITAVRGSGVAPLIPSSIGKTKQHLSGHPQPYRFPPRLVCVGSTNVPFRNA
jgi:hypothetical protein